MAKLPSIQFYPGDFVKDPAVSSLSHAHCGIWIRLLCYMHETPQRGTLTKSVEDFCWLLRVTPEEFNAFVARAKEVDLCDVTVVTDRNARYASDITLICRRMVRDENTREIARENARISNARRQQAWRDRQVKPPDVTAVTDRNDGDVTARNGESSSSSSEEDQVSRGDLVKGLDSSPKSKTTKQLDPNPPEPGFAVFWQQYPRKDGKQTAREAWGKLSEGERQLALADVPKRLKANWAGRDWDKIPYAATYLHRKTWTDEIQQQLPRSQPERAVDRAIRRVQEAEVELQVNNGQARGTENHSNAVGSVSSLESFRRILGTL